MQYAYEFEVFRDADWYLALPFDMKGGTQGRDMRDVCLMTADWLRSDIEHRLMHDIEIPVATFGNAPKNGGTIMIVSIEAELETVKKVSASETARMLGVTPARVTHMIRSGLLDAFKDGHRTYVTLDSVNARLASTPKAGRPRKTAVG
jgi:hypothetical protein